MLKERKRRIIVYGSVTRLWSAVSCQRTWLKSEKFRFVCNILAREFKSIRMVISQERENQRGKWVTYKSILFIVGSFQTVFPFCPLLVTPLRMPEELTGPVPEWSLSLSLPLSPSLASGLITLLFLRLFFFFYFPMIETCRSLDDLSRNFDFCSSPTDVEKAISNYPLALEWRATQESFVQKLQESRLETPVCRNFDKTWLFI